ncbi:hypothetical protein E6P78_32305 [Streptomyces sp. A0958]|uniref:hypothetical protein n=1 Tax=Streptomyces sp. A0958 TaxID=2563101 RepID=UPI00109E92AB|nr:hypothetical protein [Streptomyces sp. A0958]THA56254.1 hypothetical protein E6P78_32305 [Streptomyces sp. A0958]
MTRDNVPPRVQLPDPAPPVPQPPSSDRALTSQMAQVAAQGAVQGALRAFVGRAVDKLLTHPPDWMKSLWHALPRPWE